MVRNYLLISLRNLRKQFSYSVINISGLALGLATCLLLVSWIRHELSYDHFHEKSSQIYRASLEYSFGGQVAKTSVSPNALLPALITLPETQTGVRVYNPSRYTPYIVKHGSKVFEEKKFYLADSTFFDVFSFSLLRGNPKKVLNEPYTVVLTQRMADKYFPGEDPLGKTFLVNNDQDYQVTGVMENPPSNSFLQFDFIGSFYSIPAGREQPVWWNANYETYVLISPNADVTALEEKTNAIGKKAVATEITGKNDYVRYNFLPLTDLYLRSPFDESEAVNDIQHVYIFSGVALLILIIACINYINLATARAAGRAKEVGIRKVSGAQRKQLFAQFIGESFVITGISFCLAFLIAIALLPVFNTLTGKSFHSGTLFDPAFFFSALAGLFIIAFSAGAYPALALTSFNPVQVLKGNFKTSVRGITLRKSLVVAQFGMSVVLITATLIVIKQLDYIRNKKLGFDRENTIMLPLDKKTDEVFETLKSELKRSGAAVYVGRGSESAASVNAGYTISNAEKDSPGIIVRGLLGDEEYVPALGLELAAGRNFSREDIIRFTRDTVPVFILNEAALAALYIPLEEAVGKEVSFHGRKGQIIGVVKDFHFSSLHNPITPLTMFPDDRYRRIFIKLSSGDVSKNLEAVAQICSSFITHRPFEFEFLDQQYASLYKAEERMGSVAAVFATLAIIIACLGLFGLVSFAAEQKKKEIGIRKVLGASASGIVLLITRDFSRLVFISLVAGLPLAYWLMSNFWLSEFAYKTEIGFWPFLTAAAACMGIAVATTGYEAIRASLVDPAEILRNE